MSFHLPVEKIPTNMYTQKNSVNKINFDDICERASVEGIKVLKQSLTPNLTKGIEINDSTRMSIESYKSKYFDMRRSTEGS
jgi:hypothetical protein